MLKNETTLRIHQTGSPQRIRAVGWEYKMIHEVTNVIDGQPCFAQPLADILAELQRGGALQTLSPLEYYTARQRKWYRGICLPGLSDWNGDTIDEWDMRLKSQCNGIELLKTETIYLGPGSTCKRLTIQGVGKRKFTAFMENILSLAITKNWPVEPPDSDLRKEQGSMPVRTIKE